MGLFVLDISSISTVRITKIAFADILSATKTAAAVTTTTAAAAAAAM